MDNLPTQLKAIHSQVCHLQTTVYQTYLGYNESKTPLFGVEKRTVLFEVEQATRVAITIGTMLSKLQNQLLKETENEF